MMRLKRFVTRWYSVWFIFFLSFYFFFLSSLRLLFSDFSSSLIFVIFLCASSVGMLRYFFSLTHLQHNLQFLGSFLLFGLSYVFFFLNLDHVYEHVSMLRSM